MFSNNSTHGQLQAATNSKHLENIINYLPGMAAFKIAKAYLFPAKTPKNTPPAETSTNKLPEDTRAAPSSTSQIAQKLSRTVEEYKWPIMAGFFFSLLNFSLADDATDPYVSFFQVSQKFLGLTLWFGSKSIDSSCQVFFNNATDTAYWSPTFRASNMTEETTDANGYNVLEKCTPYYLTRSPYAIDMYSNNCNQSKILMSSVAAFSEFALADSSWAKQCATDINAEVSYQSLALPIAIPIAVWVVLLMIGIGFKSAASPTREPCAYQIGNCALSLACLPCCIGSFFYNRCTENNQSNYREINDSNIVINRSDQRSCCLP